MLILLERKKMSADHISGCLKIIDENQWKVVYETDTIEPGRIGSDRDANLAIPCGSYELELTYSPRFKEDLPLVSNLTVPQDRGIRIHAGNRPNDTEGCILVGEYDATSGTLRKSRLAIQNFKKMLSQYQQTPLKFLILDSFN